MIVHLNGREHELEDGATAVALLGIAPDERGVAVALEREVVPRRRWADTPVPPGARIEVVRAIQGG
jgi:sulfur carrier protein